uniref:Uncharacterized protein n=1 Tax=Hyaloperonospora arabidopsidis (strain Emoy2) TaxID=559515 RepID=M4BVX6_HYAAE
MSHCTCRSCWLAASPSTSAPHLLHREVAAGVFNPATIILLLDAKTPPGAATFVF